MPRASHQIAGRIVILRIMLAASELVPALFCRKSFFSGHASFSLYTMLYLVVSDFTELIDPLSPCPTFHGRMSLGHGKLVGKKKESELLVGRCTLSCCGVI